VTNLNPNVITNISVTTIPPSLVVNTQNVQIKININFVDTFRGGFHYIQLVFPSNFNITNSSVGSTFSGLGTSSFNATTKVLTLVSTAVKNYWSGVPFFVSISPWTVPPSINVTSPIYFNVLLNNFTTQTGSVTLQPIISTSISVSITPTLTTVSQNTSYLFSLTYGDPLSSTGMILITFPSTVTPSFSSSNCASIVGIGFNSNPICSLITANTVLLTNLNSSNTVLIAQTINITLNGIINPPTT
jgi:hypothetical protein